MIDTDKKVLAIRLVTGLELIAQVESNFLDGKDFVAHSARVLYPAQQGLQLLPYVPYAAANTIDPTILVSAVVSYNEVPLDFYKTYEQSISIIQLTR